jgi:D-alanyl-D-alanine carboxypeptidase/D-alanyl-D-alanine-endopeptidase (penicillin-binding protein 4)
MPAGALARVRPGRSPARAALVHVFSSWTAVSLATLLSGGAGGAPPSRARPRPPRADRPADPPAAVAAPTPTPLGARLQPLLRVPVLNGEETGAAVLLLPGGSPLLLRNADRLMRPASTLKIVTTAAALALLKPEYVYQTGILADGPIEADGTLRGNLIVRGSGAPDLVGESWWLMARRLAARGLRRVEGDLVADESYFDAVRRPPGWPQPAADSWYNAPVGALSCNFNVVTVRVDPSPLLGGRPDVTLEPIASYFQLMNRATTVAGATSLAVTRAYDDGRNTLDIRGTLRRGAAPVVVHRGVEEPGLYALHCLQEIARGEGITVGGALRLGTAPETAREIDRFDSRPLAALVRDMNKNSNNFMAEAILKTLGAQFVETPGTTNGGLSMVRTYLSGLGLDAGFLQAVDGSGLSDHDRTTARLLAEVLAKGWSDFEIGADLVASLPIGGADGTLEERFASETQSRRVRAKTGRIAGAVTLAGYAVNRDGRPFAFAIFANQPRGSLDAVHQALDRVVDEIVQSADSDVAPLLP